LGDRSRAAYSSYSINVSHTYFTKYSSRFDQRSKFF